MSRHLYTCLLSFIDTLSGSAIDCNGRPHWSTIHYDTAILRLDINTIGLHVFQTCCKNIY